MNSSESALREVRESVRRYVRDHVDHSFDPANPVVRLHEPTFGADEIWEALESMLTTQVTMGPKVRRFESEFADAFGYRDAVMVNSGSSANLLAVAALCNPAAPDRLQPGDEVIVPAVCWSTTVWPLIQHGLVPVIVDIDPATMNLSPDAIEDAVGPRTRGIMPVHVYGNPCDMQAIIDIVTRHRLMLIEDACEALGTEYGGNPAGTFGRVGSFSFYFSHHITTLEGGMCVTQEPDLGELIRVLRAHGCVRNNRHPETHTEKRPEIDPKFLFVNLGYNLRATELQGGFGYVQLPKLRGFIDIREQNALFWRQEFSDYDGSIFGLQQPTPNGKHSWFGFPMTVLDGAPFQAAELTSFLNSRGIETRPIIAGNIAAQPGLEYYEHRVAGDLPAAQHVMRSGFTFGNHQAVDERARKYVGDAVHEFVRAKGVN